MMSDKLGYRVVNNTTTTIKPTPAGFFGLSVTGAGNVTVYDNASAGSGVVLYMRQEGRGIGLAPKILAYKLQESGYAAAPGECKENRHYYKN